jgi:UDP:flavonoid glycosyltransferase YjiC (YdhE family)
MAGFVFATHASHSHVGPMVPVVRELVRRGHDVTWYTGEPYRAKVESSGAMYAPPRHGYFPELQLLEEEHPSFARLSPADRARWFLDNAWAAPAEGQYRDLSGIFADTGADVLVTDAGIWAANLLHETSGTLWATVCQSPLPLPDPALPPRGTGRHPGSGRIYRMRNAIAHRRSRGVLEPAGRRLNAIRQELGLAAARGARPTPYLFLQATTPSFEYPRASLPPQVHFIGALLPDPPATFTPPRWWDELDSDRPVVLVTQGTTAKNPTELIIPAITGLAGSDVLVVVTTGRDGTDIGVDPLPGNVRVASFLPYTELMPKLAAVVTNGGYGTVQQSLAHGLPLVVAGRTDDKPEVCARVSWCGGGIDLRTHRPAPRRIAAAVRKVLSDPVYRQRARRMAAEYATHDARRTAADLLERLAATRSAVARVG